MPQRLRQVVDDEPVPAREELGPNDVDLPSRQVVVDAVHVRRVVICLGQGLEEVGGGQHGGHGPRRVADEDHRGLGRDRAVAARERFVREVVLERVDQAAFHALVPGKFIEGDDVPVADQTDASGRVVDEELRERHLAARHEHAVGRELGVDVRFSGALGAQFNEVVVAFDVGNEAGQLEEFRASTKLRGVEADRGDEQVDPLVGAERGAPPAIAFEIKTRQLDSLKAGDDPRAGRLRAGVSRRHV